MRRLDLRTRLVAGIALVVAVQVVVAVIVVSTTSDHLIGQIDDRLAVSQSPDRLERPPAPPEADPLRGPERLGDTYEGILLADGTLVTVFAPNTSGEDLAAPVVDAATAAEAAVSPVSVDGADGDVRYRLAAAAAADGAYFITAIPLDGVDATVSRLITVVGVTAGAISLILVLVAMWVLRLGIAPIKRMTATAGAIAAGDLSERVSDTDPRTEAGALGAALNTMMATIEGSFAERLDAEERLRRFIADASHELRTPVTTIRGYAELYEGGGLGNPDDLDDAMRRTGQESQRMSRLIDDMLNLARLDQHPTLSRTVVDMGVLVQDAGRDAQATQPERPIQVRVDSQPLEVMGDEDLLRQVLGNIVGNAIVHTDADDAIRLRATRQGGMVVVEVSDDGPGMEPEVAERITERFFRADVSRSRNRGGSGLGLSIVDAGIRVHGGTLHIESAPGAGTTYRVGLPTH